MNMNDIIKETEDVESQLRECVMNAYQRGCVDGYNRCMSEHGFDTSYADSCGNREAPEDNGGCSFSVGDEVANGITGKTGIVITASESEFWAWMPGYKWPQHITTSIGNWKCTGKTYPEITGLFGNQRS